MRKQRPGSGGEGLGVVGRSWHDSSIRCDASGQAGPQSALRDHAYTIGVARLACRARSGLPLGPHEEIERLEQAWAAWQYPDLSRIQASASSQGVIGATSSTWPGYNWDGQESSTGPILQCGACVELQTQAAARFRLACPWGRVSLARLVRYEAEQDGDHEFCIYDLDADPGGDLVEELANLVRQLYVDTQRLREVLQQAAVGLEPVADASRGMT
jgi:hypothetical protein